MAAIAQLGERQTEDLKVPGSIPGLGKIAPCAKLTRPATCYSVQLAHDLSGHEESRKQSKQIKTPTNNCDSGHDVSVINEAMNYELRISFLYLIGK